MKLKIKCYKTSLLDSVYHKKQTETVKFQLWKKNCESKFVVYQQPTSRIIVAGFSASLWAIVEIAMKMKF